MLIPSSKQIGKQHILYDPSLVEQIELAFFDPEFWRQAGALVGQASGRGTTFFVEDKVHVYALRHYRRGGMLAGWLGDCYVWAGRTRSRAWQEWHLLKWMFDAGLPVPRPVAARVLRHRWTYSADLVTLLLPDCRSLGEVLGESALSSSLWGTIGETVRRFHDAGIDHADLNAHNILLGKREKTSAGDAVYLIDFDKGRRHSTTVYWKKNNLSRLHRSLVKVAGQGSHPNFSEPLWEHFLAGYHREDDASLS